MIRHYNLALVIIAGLLVWAIVDLPSFLILCVIIEIATYVPRKQYRPGRWERDVF